MTSGRHLPSADEGTLLRNGARPISGARPRAEAGDVPAPCVASHPLRDPIRRAKVAKLFGENPPHDPEA